MEQTLESRKSHSWIARPVSTCDSGTKSQSSHEIGVDEGRDKSSTRSIDVDVNVESLLGVVLDEEVVDPLDVFVLSRVSRSEDYDDVRISITRTH